MQAVATKGETPKAATNGVSREEIQTLKKGISEMNSTVTTDTVKTDESYSFVKRGETFQVDYFNVKKNEFIRGQADGFLVMAEIVGKPDYEDMADTLEAVIKDAVKEYTSGSKEKDSRRGAACSFLYLVGQVLEQAVIKGIAEEVFRREAEYVHQAQMEEAKREYDDMMAFLPSQPKLEPEIRQVKRKSKTKSVEVAA